MNKALNLLSRRFLTLIIVVLILPAELHAEELPPGMIMVEGMRFYCPSCQKASGNNCELVLEGDLTQLSCSKLLEVLLSQELNQPEVSYPTAAELERFLLDAKPSASEAKSALRLLARTSEGVEHLERSVAVLLARYPDIVGDLLNEGWGTERIWQQVIVNEVLIGDRPAAESVGETENPKFAENPPALIDQSVTAGEQDGRRAGAGLFTLLLAILGVSLALLLKRGREVRSEKTLGSKRPEREELRMLRRYFRLSLEDGVPELNREYRERARKLHPDTGSGNAEGFMLLTERYHRAKELLSATAAAAEEEGNYFLKQRKRSGER